MKKKSIDTQYVKNLIINLGFKLADGVVNIYSKSYSQFDNYQISVNFDENKIDYGKLIRKGDNTTSNFAHPENFVILECVNRLIEKGYPPQTISLEHNFHVGRTEKGKLDIFVSDVSDLKLPYLMIECKTWGNEYESEKRRTMSKEKNQLFSYYIQDRKAKFILLYASTYDNDSVKYKNAIVKTEEEWIGFSNIEEIWRHWNKNFSDYGIFEDDVNAYNVVIKSLTGKMLNVIDSENSRNIFNQFMEILRHNVVSDKPNAFNKILNLFICKIIDEDKSENEELDFQWKNNDTFVSLQLRLNDLYKRGMREFLNIDVCDYSDDDLEDKLNVITTNPDAKQQIHTMFNELRLQKNPEFAFKEVYDADSFNDNAIVVKEVVELLQPYRFRYGSKQQFLGDFFENLLHTSMKQEAGQFFTPTPIAKFIISSLPVQDTIQSHIENGSDILPYVIDYAVGSGHFLTEWLDAVQKIISTIDTSKLSTSVKRKIDGWKDNFLYDWAKEYVFGIDADYRLVKTAKVNAFLNGDGEANLIHANGLDSFNSDNYTGKLKSVSSVNTQDNGNFDFVISNPPYSISAFKKYIPNGNESFSLFDKLTDASSEIECLFVERTKQLLKKDGIAGIILPNSILFDKGIYKETRNIILQFFKIVAVMPLTEKVFMATGTHTVIMFLKRRGDFEYQKIMNQVSEFMETPNDYTINGVEHAIPKYVETAYSNTLSFAEYCKLIQKKSINIPAEITKISNFILLYNDKTILVDIGKKEDSRKFIGYKFSTRRNQEGLKMLKNKSGEYITKLFNTSNVLEPTKVDFYIRNAFKEKYFEIDDSLKDNISIVDTQCLFNYCETEFDNKFKIKRDVDFKEIWQTDDLIEVGNVSNIEKGKTITKEIADTETGTIPVVLGGKTSPFNHSMSNRDGNVITISASGANAGYVNYWEVPIFAGDCYTVISTDENVLPTKVIYALMLAISDEIISMNYGNAQPHIYDKDISKIKIPNLKSLKIKPKDVLALYEKWNDENPNKRKSWFDTLSEYIHPYISESTSD